ncbi:TPA: hypothetical protein EYN98_07090 [Candidatus Poribacteria bacterium]|nr:hypothetical protein [Flavobacteriales bacterium]HIA65815.1 hypothetical protein [Candidatus Poribacteria bacterium]
MSKEGKISIELDISQLNSIDMLSSNLEFALEREVFKRFPKTEKLIKKQLKIIQELGLGKLIEDLNYPGNL